LLIIVGLFAGFGKSPYSFTPTYISLNLFFIVSLLLGTELSRSYLIKKGSKKRQLNLTLILVTLVFLFIQISPDRYGLFAFTDLALSLEFLGKTVITGLSIGLLASYLSYLGGATASIAYIGTLTVFEWFSPILPNPHWTISALVGTIAPAIGYIVIQTSSQTPQQIRKERRRKQSGGYGWTIAAIFCVLIVFFSFGYLGVKPTVIYSGSMQPALNIGDIAIVEKIDPSELREGDIIQYVNERNDTIMHRLVLIENIEGEIIFTTKGDANELPDSPPIKEQRILGKSIFTIPKIGLIQIYVRNILKSINIPIN
jgi:signal peptidase